jgi:hypothetical protein
VFQQQQPLRQQQQQEQPLQQQQQQQQQQPLPQPTQQQYPEAAPMQQPSKAKRPRPRSRTTSAGDSQASSSTPQPVVLLDARVGSLGQVPPAAAGTAVGECSFFMACALLCFPHVAGLLRRQQVRTSNLDIRFCIVSAGHNGANIGPQQPAATQQQPTPSSTPATAAAAAEASSTEFDSAVRNKFSSRPQAALQPPSQQPSAAAADWCGQLGIDAAVLQQWGAGMATVPHPETKQLVRSHA